jgi:hypothetical protein
VGAGQDDEVNCKEDDCNKRVYARDWCAMHYKRWLRTGSPIRGERPKQCSVEGCEGQAKSRGWCHAHYQRWRRLGDVKPDKPIRAPRPCEVANCDREHYARGLCNTHYRRLLNGGDVRADDPIRIVTGTGYLHHGYWVVAVPEDERWLVGGEAAVGEHRLTMARHLGRALLPDETVHHRNGVRTDNRLENLELWSSAHPKGQRVEDKLAFALDMLTRYAPEWLSSAAPESKRPPRDGGLSEQN